MTPALLSASRRFAARHPWQVALAVLGIALGVAVVAAIDLTRASARRAFDDATVAVTGRSTHQIVGGPRGLAETQYLRLRRAGALRQAAPVIEASVTIGNGDAQRVRLLGVDPLVEPPLRGRWSGGGAQTLALLARPGTALVSRSLAGRLGLGPGAMLAVVLDGRVEHLEMLDLFDPGAREGALATVELVVVDIATAQELLAMAGRISRIDLVLEDAAAVARVRALLDAGAALVPAAARQRATASMTRAFHTNLAALSLLALLVGMFLVYNSQTFLVLQRRPQLGILRALGVRRRELAQLVLVEAGVLGVLGTALGLLLGYALAQGLLGLVDRTVNDLYYTASIRRLAFDAGLVGKDVLLGVAGSLAAAAVPALEAMRVAPRLALSRADVEWRSHRLARLGATLGAACWLAGAGTFALPGHALLPGFAGLFLVIVGCVLVTPLLTVAGVAILARVPVIRRHPGRRLAVRGVAGSLSRTGVAIAALMLAVATTIGIGIMVASFRHAVADWLGTLLRADYYVTAGDTPATIPLARSDAAAIARVPGVAAVSHVRRVHLESETGGDDLHAYQLTDAARRGFRLRTVDRADTFWQRFESGDTVMVSEPYAYHRNVGVGARIVLRTDTGARTFTVGAVYQDYASERGSVAMSRATYDRYWRDDGVSGIGVYADPAFDLQQLRAALRVLPHAAGIELHANRDIRARSLAVFDRTFTITEVLRVLAGVIAFIGVVGALLAIELERARELAVLKALGLTAGEIRRLVLGETALIGTAAGLIAMPVGVAIAALLVYVINRRSFGWSMALEIDPGILAGGFALALAAALLAGLYPARRMARTQPAAVLRGE
ncbi:MAG: ABC transporter permease [Gammaproteobacteria bacterium]|nr:ABC transporter permease [Gammaproteobacteria bacterium]